VRVDGARAAERLVRGGGLRRDRRLYVFDEAKLRARVDTTIAVRLDRVDPGAAVPETTRPDRAAAAPSTTSVPPHAGVAAAGRDHSQTNAAFRWLYQRRS
jgi:hypothetical protein